MDWWRFLYPVSAIYLVIVLPQNSAFETLGSVEHIISPKDPLHLPCDAVRHVQPGEKMVFDSTAILHKPVRFDRNARFYRKVAGEPIGTPAHLPIYQEDFWGHQYHHHGMPHPTRSRTTSPPPEICKWAFTSDGDCHLTVYMAYYWRGDPRCSKQYLMFSDNTKEIQVCGSYIPPYAFVSETDKLTIKFFRRPFTYLTSFQGYVTCDEKQDSYPYTSDYGDYYFNKDKPFGVESSDSDYHHQTSNSSTPIPSTSSPIYNSNGVSSESGSYQVTGVTENPEADNSTPNASGTPQVYQSADPHYESNSSTLSIPSSNPNDLIVEYEAENSATNSATPYFPEAATIDSNPYETIDGSAIQLYDDQNSPSYSEPIDKSTTPSPTYPVNSFEQLQAMSNNSSPGETIYHPQMDLETTTFYSAPIYAAETTENDPNQNTEIYIEPTSASNDTIYVSHGPSENMTIYVDNANSSPDYKANTTPLDRYNSESPPIYQIDPTLDDTTTTSHPQNHIFNETSYPQTSTSDSKYVIPNYATENEMTETGLVQNTETPYESVSASNDTSHEAYGQSENVTIYPDDPNPSLSYADNTTSYTKHDSTSQPTYQTGPVISETTAQITYYPENSSLNETKYPQTYELEYYTPKETNATYLEPDSDYSTTSNYGGIVLDDAGPDKNTYYHGTKESNSTDNYQSPEVKYRNSTIYEDYPSIKNSSTEYNFTVTAPESSNDADSDDSIVMGRSAGRKEGEGHSPMMPHFEKKLDAPSHAFLSAPPPKLNNQDNKSSDTTSGHSSLSGINELSAPKVWVPGQAQAVSWTSHRVKVHTRRTESRVISKSVVQSTI